MKWLIVEDALRDRRGHWYEYVSTFRRGLEELGDELEIMVSRECAQEVVSALRARPVLPASIWAKMSDGAGALRRYARVPGHGCATFLALRRVFSFQSSVGREQKAEGRMQIADSKWLDAEGGSNEWAPDVIFVPTVLVHHLLGWWLLLKTGSVPNSSRVLLFFPNAPVRLADDGCAHMAPDATGRLFRWCIRQLADEVGSGKVILGAETHAMRRALTEATGVEFTYLPHPVSAELKRGVKSDENRSKSEIAGVNRVARESRERGVGGVEQPPEDRDRQPELPDASARPTVFGCYGAARWEKGTDILQAAIRQVLEEDPQIPAKFVFQWVEDFNDDRGERVTLDPWVRDHPKVEVIQRYFEEGEYEHYLAETDVMVLPYRSPYRLRVSRVVIEGIVRGLCVIAPESVTLFQQASEYGAAVGFKRPDPQGVAQAMHLALGNSDHLRVLGKARSQAAKEAFSVQEFRKRLALQIVTAE